MKNELRLMGDLINVESYKEGIDRICKENDNISYDPQRDEFVKKEDSRIYTYPAKSLYENDFFTGGIFEEEVDYGKPTCAIDSVEMNTVDEIIEKCEKGYSVFEYHKKGIPGYKLWDIDEFYPTCKLLSQVGDFMIFTLQNHILFTLLDVGYEKVNIEDVMDYKLDYASYVLNIDIKEILHQDNKLQGVVLNYGIIDALEKKYKELQ